MISTKTPKYTCSFGRSVSTAAVDCWFTPAPCCWD